MRIRVKVPDGFEVNADRLARAVKQSLLGEADPEKIWRLNDVPAIAQLEEGVYAAGAQDVAAAFERTARVLGLPADTAWLDKALKRKKPNPGQLSLEFSEEDHPRLKAGETLPGYEPGQFVPKEAVPVVETEPEQDPEPSSIGLSTQGEMDDFRARLAAWDDRHMTPQLFDARSLEWEDKRRPVERTLTDYYQLQAGVTEAEEDRALKELQAWRQATWAQVQEYRNRSQAWRDRQAARDRQELGIAGLVKLIEAGVGGDTRELERRLNQVYILEEADKTAEQHRRDKEQRVLLQERAKKLDAIERYQTPTQLYTKAAQLMEVAARKRLADIEQADRQNLSPEAYAAVMTKTGGAWDKAKAKATEIRAKADAITEDILHWRKQWGYNSGWGLDNYSTPSDPRYTDATQAKWAAGRKIDAAEAKRLKLPVGTTIYTPEEDNQSRIYHDLGNGFAYVGPPEPALLEAAAAMQAKIEGRVPAAMREKLTLRGVRNVFTAAPPYRWGTNSKSQEGYFQHWLSKSKVSTPTMRARGFYASDDIKTGVFFSGSKAAVSQVGARGGSICTVLHEYGHAVDYNWPTNGFKLSDEPEFQSIWEACKPYLAPYYFHDPQELFAEGFDSYTESDDNRERLRTGPPGYRQLAAYFDKLFAEAEAPVSKSIKLRLTVPARLKKNLESGPTFPVEDDVTAGFPFWTATDHDPELGAICWEGPVPPEEYENLLEASQPAADMVNEEE